MTKRLTLALAASLALAGCGGGGSAHSGPSTSSPAQRTSPMISMFEDPAALAGDPTGTLDTLQRLGVDDVRVFLGWRWVAPDATAPQLPAGVQPASPSAYSPAVWTTYDAIVRGATARGMGVDLTLTGPAPEWATGSGAPPGAPPGVWHPDPSRFGEFVRAVATRYSGSYVPPGASTPLPRVHMWSIWNEPNYGVDLAPQATDQTRLEVAPWLYRNLVDAAWSALSASGHGRDTILIGELAPRGQTYGNHPGNFDGMVPVRFLRALYCLDGQLRPLRASAASARGCPTTSAASSRFVSEHPALFQASGYALHLYPQGAESPDAATFGESDYADLAALPTFEHTLDSIVHAYGSAKRFAIYDMEFGYKTNPPYKYGAPLNLAAHYLSWSEYLHWRDPRVMSYDQYLLKDPPSNGTSDFDTGLEFADGGPKPSYYAFRLPLFMPVASAHSAAALEVWGCVRPADTASAQSGGSQVATLQFAPSATNRFTTLRRVVLADPSGYFDLPVRFTRSGQVRLAWTAPHGPTIYSLPIRVTIG